MKILMAAMSMGLGGAETHIYELSRELVRRGHEVFVASDGGAYADMLSACGVKHVKAPLHTKKPVSVAKASRILSELMKREKFDVVHAHARIPAFICGKLRAKYGFPFITTAHFDFRTDALLSRITDWGDRVLAVSEDIAESVAEKYGYVREKISLVNNGIDSERFSPENSGEAIREKLGLADKKTVMYLGRLDADSYLPADLLIDSAESILGAYPDARIVITGNGEKYGYLSKKAVDVNEKLGTEAVILTGGTSSPEEYVAACDVFVGPSRSAMEALASGKPTVVAGTFGMLGIFSRETEGEALRTNFCCRGDEPATAKRVSECVLQVLSYSAREREAVSSYGREFIKEHYSVSLMTDTCEKAYAELISEKGINAVICGYYGYGNTGDEAMLRALVDSLSENGRVSKISVMSSRPLKTAERFGTEALPRYDIKKLCSAFASADVMIFGGGNILQDKTSTKSLLYYTHIIELASRYACRIALCANGIGPITRKKNMDTVRKALLLADYISMRDADSLALAAELTGRTDIYSSGDLAFAGEIQAHGSEKTGYYAVFPKNMKDMPAETMLRFFRLMKSRYGLVPVFAAMHAREDSPLCRKLASKLPWAVFAENARDTASMGKLLSGAEFSVCMRLHAAVFSVMSKCPMIAVSDDTKMGALFSACDMGGCELLDAAASPSEMCEAVSRVMANREYISEHLENEALLGRAQARRELDRLGAFIAGGI